MPPSTICRSQSVICNVQIFARPEHPPIPVSLSTSLSCIPRSLAGSFSCKTPPICWLNVIARDGIEKVSVGALPQVFLGIPYATPPVRSNRFSPTRTPLPWDGVKLADTMAPACPQRLPDISNETASLERMPKGRLEYLRRLQTLLQNQSEDCLYLNVYAPAQGKSQKENFCA